ncbi:MAG: right-handed parallel beta-helix repeat-containing protein [Terriglobales bacterium]
MHPIKTVILFLPLLLPLSVRAQLIADCARDSPKTIFIAIRKDGANGSGVKADPFDGSTKTKFDTILRDRAEARESGLIVCIGRGTFDTEGSYDYIIGVGHQGAMDHKYPLAGFTVGKNWKIHGSGSSGAGRTTLRLSDIYPYPRKGIPLGATVVSTISDSASGVEISDLEIDDNYRAIPGNANLAAISLRSDEGGNWIHRVNVINAEGRFSEAFPVLTMSVNFHEAPSKNNVIEYVTMSHWGGGQCTAIAMANATGEVRHNQVNGYQIAFGGWALGPTSFRDNTAIDTEYGFNFDSDNNTGVIVQNNSIIHPQSYGIVIGGSARYSNFKILANTIEVNKNSVDAILLQGHVTHALISDNHFIADSRSIPFSKAIAFKGDGNNNNAYNSNHIDRRFEVAKPDKTSCIFSNVDEMGRPIETLRNTQSKECVSELHH